MGIILTLIAAAVAGSIALEDMGAMIRL